jgi:hypothetical protein
MQAGQASTERSSFGAIVDIVDAFASGGGTSMPHYLLFRPTEGGEAILELAAAAA